MTYQNETALLYRMDASKNMRRFYSMSILPDLFGGHSLHRNWGRIGTCGTMRIDYFNQKSDAVSAYETLVQQKCKRGYFAM